MPLSKTYNGNVADTGYPVPTSFIWDPWSDPLIVPCCYIVRIDIRDRAVLNNGVGRRPRRRRLGGDRDRLLRSRTVHIWPHIGCGRRTGGGRMATKEKRGSEKVMAAWKARVLTEASIKEIAASFEKSPATIEGATFFGGEHSTGLSLSLSYEGDDGPWCGNDILFWLKWHLGHGGNPRPPRIIINGTPFPISSGWSSTSVTSGEQAGGIQELAGELGAAGFHG